MNSFTQLSLAAKIAGIIGIVTILTFIVAGTTREPLSIAGVLRSTGDEPQTPNAAATPVAPTDAFETAPVSIATEALILTPTPSPELTPAHTSIPLNTPTAAPSATPTLDLGSCNVAGCGIQARTVPPAKFDPNLLLAYEPQVRRDCPECPANPVLSEAELNDLLTAEPALLARLETLALSQNTYELAPGVVYLVYDNVHHVVIDLKESGYVLRNIIPENVDRGTLITPSYCHTPNSLVVVDADYHGLDGSNKTETGRDLFFHLGRAAVFQRDGRFDLDVIRQRKAFDRTTISWGGGPIFVWDGEYNFNPEQEWFEEDVLDYYRDTYWAKVSVALTQERKYMFLSISYNISLKEHAENVIGLGQTWGLKVDRAMRFDGGESAYMAIRLEDKMVPILNLPEPLIVNCLAVEKVGE